MREPLRNSLRDGLVRSQLEKMLASEIFSRSERLSRFLRYIVEQTLDAQADGLKESVLAAELYGRGFEFEAATDPIVRVDARRLRDKLREYYSEADRDPMIISLPKGATFPVFRLNPPAPIPTVMPSIAEAENVPHAGLSTHWRRWPIAAACLLAFIAASIMAREWHIRTVSSTELKIIPLTVFPGEEGPPSLSPDGNVVAFACGRDPTNQGAAHLGESCWWRGSKAAYRWRCIRNQPAWSPDGREIAFVRAGQGVYVSQLGGLERKIASSGTHVGWSADGRSVLIRDRAGDAPFGIFQILIKTLDRRQLTHAPAGIGDWTFAVSPDGKTLAFSRCERPGAAISISPPWMVANRSVSRTGTICPIRWHGLPTAANSFTRSNINSGGSPSGGQGQAGARACRLLLLPPIHHRFRGLVRDAPCA
jgi:hypothetical protein